jgi:hypothetical protein
MGRITGTGEGIKFLISAFNMVKRGEVKNLDQLMQFAKQQFGDLDSGFMDQIKDAFKKGQSSAITEKRTKDIAKGDVVEEEGLSSLMKSLEEKAGNLKKTLDESKKSSSTMLEDALDAATGFKRSTGSKDKAKPFRTPGMPYQRENPDYRLPGGSMYAEGNLRTAIRQFLRSEIEAGNLKVNDTDAFRVKEYSPMSEDDPIDVFRRYYGEDALQAADDMADALKEGTSFKNYEEIFRRDMPEIKVKTEGAGEYDAIIKETEALLKKAKDEADYAKTLDEFDVADRKKNNMGGINRIGFAKGRIQLAKYLYDKGTDLATEIKKAVDNIFASGDSKYDADVAVDSALEELGVDREMFLPEDITNAYGQAYNLIVKQKGLASQKVPGSTQVFKDSEGGIKGITMGGDKDFQKAMSEAMEEGMRESENMKRLGLDPSKMDDALKYDEMKEAGQLEKNVTGLSDMSEADTLIQKYPGMTKELADQIANDPDPQRKAQVISMVEQTFKMSEKGMSGDEIIDAFKKGTDRTKQANGGLSYLMGM